ncbi:MAG: T9SS type A sorting domain-containing protein [Lewinellaceae bacterium]|nr:T9SS type A sorting domain-containing protein [Lewinellaceae bacterium]
MNRFLSTCFTIAVTTLTAQAQIAWTDPIQVNPNQPVTLYVDLGQTNCPNIGIGNPTPDVYIWTWLPSENLASGGNGQWDNSNEAHKMTAQGSNIWSFTFSPSLAAFYNVTPQQALSSGLAFLLKRDNGGQAGVCSGEAKTQDIILPLQAASVHDLQPADELQVSPNPATDLLNISLNSNTVTSNDDLVVELVDFMGRTALRRQWNREAWNIADLAAGQYVVRLVGEKTMWVQRIVKE